MTTTELDHLLSYTRDKRLGLSASAMTGHADALEAAGLAVRTFSKADRRASFLQITDKGGDLITNCLLGPALV